MNEIKGQPRPLLPLFQLFSAFNISDKLQIYEKNTKFTNNPFERRESPKILIKPQKKIILISESSILLT